MKVQLHTHTEAGSYDGGLTPIQLAEAYRNSGFDAVAITDHDTVTEPPDVDGITLMRGVEHTEDAGRHLHVVELVDHDFKFLAHPGFTFSWVEDGMRYARARGLDGIERFNGGVEHFEAGAAADLLELATDDAHNVWQVNHSYLDVNAASRSEDDIMAAVKAGDYTLESTERRLRGLIGFCWKCLSYGISHADKFRGREFPDRETALYEKRR